MVNGLVSTIKTRLSDRTIILLLVAAIIALRVAMLPMYPVPEPITHDEFANILGAKTFAAGHLTNPAPELVDSFREIHVLPEPTRMMKYQPGTALFLALGIVLTGNPYWGMVICVSLMIAAGYWAMRAWTSKPIALAGAVMMILLFRTPHYWIQGYWGGTAITLASFLLLGSYAQVFLHKRFGYAWLGMAGVALAALSRPYEGLVLVLSLCLCAALSLRQFDAAERRMFLKKSAPAILIAAGAYITLQLYYNYVITGHALMLPYLLYEKLSGVASLFVFEHARPENVSPHYLLSSIQRWEIDHFQNRAPYYFLYGIMDMLYPLVQPGRFPFIALNALGVVALVIAIYCLPLYFLIRDWQTQHPLRKSNLVLFTCLMLVTLGFSLSAWLLPHYAGAYFAVWVVLACRWCLCHVTTERQLRILQWSYAIICLVMVAFAPRAFVTSEYHVKNRVNIREQLMTNTGNDLVFVDQAAEGKKRALHEAWVRNEPNLDNAPIIWAWYLSAAENQKVIAQYKNRKVWYVKPDREHTVFMPYDQFLKERR